MIRVLYDFGFIKVRFVIVICWFLLVEYFMRFFIWRLDVGLLVIWIFLVVSCVVIWKYWIREDN